MELHAWLEAERGRAKALAEALGVSKTAVSLWQENEVPLQYMNRIVELSGGEVDVKSMAEHAIACRIANSEKRQIARAA